MRRLAELFTTIIQNPKRRGGMRVSILSLLLAFTLFTFTSFAHAQTTKVVSDFEDGQMDGWVQNGSPATLAVSTDTAHSGTHSLKIAGRTGSEDGASLDLLPIMQPGEGWEFSVWVRLAPGATPDTIGLKVHDPVTSDWGGWPVVANADNGLLVTDKAWVQLKGRYPMSGMLNPGGSELKMWFITGKAETNFYVDDFVIWKQAPSGCYSTPDITGDTSDFETELNWIPRGWSGVTLTLTTEDKHSGSQSLLQSNRGDTWKTAAYIATGKMCNGFSYKLSAWVKMAPGMPAADMNIQAAATKGSDTSYIYLTPTKTVTDQGWVELTGTYDWWNNYDTLMIYVNPMSDKTSSFYVDDFSVQYVPLNQAVENIPGIGAAYQTFFPVGAAVHGPDVTPGDVHADLLARHFTSVTPENDMKWSATEATEGNFDYTKAQAIVDFAKTNGMAVRGHTLVWDQQTPDWVFQDPNDPTQPASKTVLQDRMKKHIQALIGHFGADVTSWDVVNEAFDESQPDGFRHGKWYNTYGGPGYIDDAFNYAHEALVSAGLADKVKLYLNDYNTTVPTKLSYITSYLTAAKAAAVPVDGVGHQLHNKLDWPVNDDPTSISAITNAIDSVANLGFDNQVTEMDISIYRNLKQQTTYEPYADIAANLSNDLVVQGHRYNDYFSAFKTLASAGKLSSVTLWGQADDHTWLTSTTTADAPLPFDRSLTHKWAYTGIMDATSLPNALPHAYDADVKVTFDTPTAITLPGTDADHDTLNFTIVTKPTNGALSVVTGNKVTYTPTTGYFGTDSFTYTANDGKGDSNVGTINVTVLPTPPVAQDQTVAVNINTPEAITLVAAGDGTVTYSIVTEPTHGTLSGTAPNLTYTPAADYRGTDSFTFKANNGTDSNTAVVTLNISLEPPVAADQSVMTPFNTAVAVTLSATGQGTITYAIATQPAHGTLSGNAPDLTYTPTKDYWGTDTFTFKANNGSDSNAGKVTIKVQPAAPVGVDQPSVTVEYARPTRLTLKATGNVLDNGTMTFTIVDQPYYCSTTTCKVTDRKPRGTLQAVPNSAACSNGACTADYIYTATTDDFKDQYLTESGSEKATFTFKASNGHDSNTATVAITVKPAALMVNAVASQNTSATVNAGESTTFNLQVTGFQNYTVKQTAQVTFVCGNIPANATCFTTPLQVSLNDNMTPVPFSVTIVTKSTTGAAAGAISMPGSGPRMPWLPICALAGFALVFIAMKRTSMQWRMLGASAALLFTMSLTACGGHSSDTSKNSNTVTTPAGTYTVTVTAVATHNVGATNLTDWKVTGDVPLTLTVK